MKVFAGWDKRQAEAAEVFAFSAACSVTFVSADLGTCKRRGVTAFTFARFAVPHLCGYEGRALFCDGCDQLALGDLTELADLDMAGAAVMVVKHGGVVHPRPRTWTSVMLMDCSQLRCWTPEAVETAPDAQLMRFGAFPEEKIGELPQAWNMLVEPGHDPPPGAKIAHWSALSDPNGDSWIDRSGSVTWRAWRERWRGRTAA